MSARRGQSLRKSVLCAVILTLGMRTSNAAVAEAGLWKRNRISVRFQAMFNIDAEFVDSGSTFASSDPGPDVGSNEDRFYDNGFNREDITGNNHGGAVGTWFWDYSDPAQVAAGNLVFESTSATATGSTMEADEPYLGFQLVYNRQLGSTGRLHYGVEGAFGFFNISITDTAPVPGTTTVVTDTFSLGGAVPVAPPTGYTYEGPHQVISSTPTRTMTTTAGTGIAGSRVVDANVYGFRLGPYVDVDLGRDWYLTLSGGLAFAAVDSDYDLYESVSLPSRDVIRSGQEANTEWVWGGYFSGNLAYAVSGNLAVFVGGEFQALGDVRQSIGGKDMILHLGGAVAGVAGVSLSF